MRHAIYEMEKSFKIMADNAKLKKSLRICIQFCVRAHDPMKMKIKNKKNKPFRRSLFPAHPIT